MDTNLDEDEMIQKEYNALVFDYLNSSHRKKTAIIEKAFNFAKQAHSGVRRRSGEPYIMHPLAVARIVAKEIGLGSTSICAALLHDVVEDTEYTTEDIASMFGEKVASIVDGLTKISGGVFANEASKQAENFRKLLLTMSEDIRVVLIKMADRLHNMRTLSSMPPAKQHKIAGETQYIYAPLAHRLGLFAIKTELENLSFLYEHPEIYHEIEGKLEATKDARTILYKEFAKPIKDKLATLPFKIEISSRIKSIFSIWNKMQRKNVSFNEIYDLLAMRIVFDLGEESMNIEEERALCWQIYSIITSLYTPHPERTRDWISTPKANGYEALHVTVMDTHGNWIEVQIRSQRMDDIAEKGFAAHWKYKEYKEGSAEQKESELDKWLKTIKELLENPDPNAMDFLDTFKLSLFASEIFIFTPKGDIKTMPINSTVLDFAFFMHTDLGLHCIGAKVNHKLVSLNHKLQAGDQVEILTSQKQQPQPEWIDFVNTARAKKEIKSLFKLEYRGFAKKGEKELNEEMKKYGVPLNTENIAHIVSEFNLHDSDDLFYKVGKGLITIDEIKKLFKIKTQSKWVNYWKLNFFGLGKKNNSDEQKKEHHVIEKGQTLKVTDEDFGKTYKIATCCNPIPGDSILGFIDEDNTIIVHKCDCPVATKRKASFGEKIVTAEWATHKMLSFPAVIEVKGFDKTGILIEILRVISEEYSVNMQKVDFETHDGIFDGTIKLYVHDTEDINNLCMKISKIKEVESVNRIFE